MTCGRRLCLRLLGLLLASLSVATQAQPQPAEAQRLVIEQTNRFRQSQGLPPVREAALLARAAQGFAHYMARTDRYGHEADGRTPAERARAQGYDFCLISENIAYEFSSEDFRTQELARRFVQGWENSPPHRANMLDPAAAETGVAIVQGPATRRYYAVQMFGRTMAQGLQFQIANTSGTAVAYVDGQRHPLPAHTTRTHRVCRPPQLSVELPGRQEPQQLNPADGQHYVIVVGGRGQLELRGL
jgi:hypothetical protein